MKILVLTVFLVAEVIAGGAVKFPDASAEGPACPIDDPQIREGPLLINATVNPIFTADLGSELVNVAAEGLSTLKYKVSVNPLLLNVTFEASLEHFTGNATYFATGYMDARPFRMETIPSGNFTGSGFGKVSATNVTFKGSGKFAQGIIGIKALMRNFTLESFSFDSLSVDLGPYFVIGGQPVDWRNYSAHIKENFDSDLATSMDLIADKIRQAINGVIGKYTLADFLRLIIEAGEESPEC